MRACSDTVFSLSAYEFRCWLDAVSVTVCPLHEKEGTTVSKVSWKTEPDAHDYPAAASYLSLIAGADQVKELIDQLKAGSAELLQGQRHAARLRAATPPA